MEAYGFPDGFIHMISFLYMRVNVNEVITGELIKRINSDIWISGTYVLYTYRVAANEMNVFTSV